MGVGGFSRTNTVLPSTTPSWRQDSGVMALDNEPSSSNARPAIATTAWWRGSRPDRTWTAKPSAAPGGNAASTRTAPLGTGTLGPQVVTPPPFTLPKRICADLESESNNSVARVGASDSPKSHSLLAPGPSASRGGG